MWSAASLSLLALWLSAEVHARGPELGVLIGEHDRKTPGDSLPEPIWHEKRQTTSGDPCAALASGTGNAYRPSQVLACVKSIPFREEVRQNIMPALTALNTLNVFEYDQIANPSPAINQGVNLEDEFRRINGSTYSSDYDFHTDIKTTVNKLNDGHYGYSHCYTTAFSVLHAMPIVALSGGPTDTATNVYLAPDLPLFVQGSGLSQIYSSAGINATQLAGAQVTQFDGQDIWEYLNTTALARVGTYQDASQRLNSIFASSQVFSGQYGRNSGAFCYTTDLSRDNFTLTVSVNGQSRQVTVPWIATYASRNGFRFTSGASFFNQVCTLSSSVGGSTSPSLGVSTARSATSTALRSGETPSVGGIDERRDYNRAVGDLDKRQGFDPSAVSVTRTQTQTTRPSSSAGAIESTAARLYRTCPLEADAANYPLVGSLNPLASGAYLGGRDALFFKLPNSETGVIVLSTFAPRPSNNTACINRMALDLVLGFRNLTQAGVKNILIDTSNNGGGSVALNQVAQRLATGNQYIQQSNFKSVFRRSPLAQALLAQTSSSRTTTGIWSAADFRDGTNILANTVNYFSPGQSRSVNGKTLDTSNDLQDSIAAIQRIISDYGVGSDPAFGPSNIVFVGNGLCGSACSSFTNFLTEYYNGSAYIHAARPAQQIQYQAFAAGQAIGSDAIYEDAADVGFRNTALLPVIGLRSAYNFALRASISPNLSPGTFLQYRPAYAQNRFALTRDMYLDPVKQWEYVASQVYPAGATGRTTGGSGSVGNSSTGGGGTGGGGGGNSGGGSGAGRRAEVGVVALGGVSALLLALGVTALL